MLKIDKSKLMMLDVLSQSIRTNFPSLILEFVEHNDETNCSYPVDMTFIEVKYLNNERIVLKGKLKASLKEFGVGTIEYQLNSQKFYRVSYSDKTKKSRKIHSLILHNRDEVKDFLSALERYILDERYANVNLDRLPPRSEWMTVEEMRELLHKKVNEWYSGKETDTGLIDNNSKKQ